MTPHAGALLHGSVLAVCLENTEHGERAGGREYIYWFPLPDPQSWLTMKFPALTVVVILVVVGGIAVWAAASAKRPSAWKFRHPNRVPTTNVNGAVGVPVGSAGCLAAACHGAPADKTLAVRNDASTWQISGSCWAAADPHGAAYSLLTDKPHRQVKVTAAQIMANYAPGTKAENDARCVACHTNPALAQPDQFNDPHARMLRNEGVSCEACHGNAGGWVTAHTSWKGPRDELYAKAGMTPLYDLGERAMNCAGCHVGAPEDKERKLPVRDMNHDMIAAGHPRLNFDFAEYLRRLPPHWQEKDRTQEPPKPRTLNSGKVWFVGRAAHAETACNLLASRAERAANDPKTPWPEFAEHSCAACHHNLKVPLPHMKDEPDENADVPIEDRDWRKTKEYTLGRPLGTPPWQVIWPMTSTAGINTPNFGSAPLKNVVSAMETGRFKRIGIPEIAKKDAAEMQRFRKELLTLDDATVDLSDGETASEAGSVVAGVGQRRSDVLRSRSARTRQGR